jgi:hypothetical protein
MLFEHSSTAEWIGCTGAGVGQAAQKDRANAAPNKKESYRRGIHLVLSVTCFVPGLVKKSCEKFYVATSIAVANESAGIYQLPMDYRAGAPATFVCGKNGFEVATPQVRNDRALTLSHFLLVACCFNLAEAQRTDSG